MTTEVTNNLIQISNDLESARENLTTYFNTRKSGKQNKEEDGEEEEKQLNPFNLLSRLRLLENSIETVNGKIKLLEEARGKFQQVLIELKLKDGLLPRHVTSLPELDLVKETVLGVTNSNATSNNNNNHNATINNGNDPSNKRMKISAANPSVSSTTTSTTTSSFSASTGRVNDELKRVNAMSQASINDLIAGNGAPQKSYVKKAEFENLPITLRGGITYEDVNSVASALVRMSTTNGGSAIPLSTLASQRLKVTGKVGEAVLNCLKALNVLLILGKDKDKVILTKSMASILL